MSASVSITIEQYSRKRIEQLWNSTGDFACSPAYLQFLHDYVPDSLYLASSSQGTYVGFSVQIIRGFRLGQLQTSVSNCSAVDDEFEFLNGLIRSLRKHRLCDKLIMPPTWCLFKTKPMGSRSCRFGSYVLSILGKSDDELMKGMHRDHRHRIRAAIRKGAFVKTGSDQFETFYELHSQTMNSSGIHCDSKKRLWNLYQRLSENNQAICAAVYMNGTPMGAVMVPYTQGRASYLFGGSANQVSPSGAIKLLHWEVIRQLRDEGVAKYDFVGARLSDVTGTKQEYLQRFKSRFGGELESGFTWKSTVCPVRSRLFDLAVWGNRKLKGGNRGNGDLIEQELKKESSNSK